MSVIAELLAQVKLGDPQVHLNLTLYPLLGPGCAEPGYRLLDEALASGCARITEVSESGSVPDLSLVNDCAEAVLLLDGEELVGAKQNRILNLTILAPPGTTLLIPVSCVEAGRWQADAAAFSSAPRAHFAEGRARKARQVSESLRTSGTRRSDQAEVWDDIARKSERLAAHSATGAAEALYATHRARLDAYRAAFAPVEGQVGALFAINGQATGFDLFDSPATLAGLLPKLVESNALDAIDALRPGSDSAPAIEPQVLLAAAAGAATTTFKALGQGEDLRLEGPGLTGGALLKDGRVVHLCAFRVEVAATGDTPAPSTRLARASVRRRRQGA